jgi:hypothetical protein
VEHTHKRRNIDGKKIEIAFRDIQKEAQAHH